MRQELRDKRLAALIECAERLFTRYGYKKTSLEDVAREAGIGKATIYHYVKGKSELFGHIVQRRFEEYAARLDDSLARVESAPDKLRLYAREVVRHHRALMEESPVPMPERAAGFEDLHHYFRRLHQLEQKRIAAVLEQGIKDGDFRPLPVEPVAGLLLATFKGAVIQLLESGGSTDALETHFLDVLYNGLLTTPAKEDTNG